MLRRAEMYGFRGLDLAVEDLGRVNVVVGRSGAGKTSLLEGLLLCTARANATLPHTLAGLRGLPSPLTGKDMADLVDEVWTRGRAPRAEFCADYRGAVHRSSLERATGAMVPALAGGGLVNAVVSYAMHTSVAVPGDQQPAEFDHFAHILADGTLWAQPSPPWDPNSYFRSTRRLNAPLDLPQGWSALGTDDRRRVVDFLRRLQPAVRDISVVVKEGPLAQLRVEHAHLGSCSPTVFGDGFVEMLTYLVLVGRARAGVLLLDEFAAPLDATTLEYVVPNFLEFLREGDVQLVASTHSLDVLDGLLAGSIQSDGMRVLQMSRDDAGEATVKNLSRDDARTLRERYGFDLRRVA